MTWHHMHMTHGTSPVGACHMASHARRLERRLSGHVASGQRHMGRRLQGCAPHRGFAHATCGTSPSRLQGVHATSGHRTCDVRNVTHRKAFVDMRVARGVRSRGHCDLQGRTPRRGCHMQTCQTGTVIQTVPIPRAKPNSGNGTPSQQPGEGTSGVDSPAVGGRLDTATGPAAHVGLPTPASERTAPPWRGARRSSPALSVGSSGRLVGLASRPATRSIRPVPGVTLPRGGDDPPVQHRRAPASRGRAPLRLRATALSS